MHLSHTTAGKEKYKRARGRRDMSTARRTPIGAFELRGGGGATPGEGQADGTLTDERPQAFIRLTVGGSVSAG